MVVHVTVNSRPMSRRALTGSLGAAETNLDVARCKFTDRPPSLPFGHRRGADARRRLLDVDGRSLSRRGNGLSRFARGGKPRLLRLLHLGERYLRGVAEREASFEIRNVRDVAAVLVAVEDVDVVVAQVLSSNSKRTARPDGGTAGRSAAAPRATRSTLPIAADESLTRVSRCGVVAGSKPRRSRSDTVTFSA
jgi:hypothetical protein